MSKTQDKTAEAEYFLNQLRDKLVAYRDAKNLNARQEFRFVLSAFLSSARSITWVLQSEYRGKTTADFESWWLTWRQRIETLPFSQLFVELRNISQKQGNRLPLLQFHSENAKGSRIEITYDPTRPGKDAIVGVAITTNNMPLHPIPPDLSEEECRKHVIETAAKDLVGFLSEEALALFVPTADVLVVDDEGKTLPYEQLLTAAAEYVGLMREMASDAARSLPH